MRTLLGPIGFALIGFITIDFVWTTLSLQGAGPLSSRLMRGLWVVLRKLCSGGWRSLMAAAGSLMVASTLVTWVFLLWLGWLCIFLSEAGSVLESSSQNPVNLTGMVYFTGFVLSTLGVGDLVPAKGLWQILTPLASFHGLTVTTIAISYVVSVISAAVGVRQLAAHVTALGSSPQELVLSGWNGRDFDGLSPHLTTITPTLLRAAQAHLAYPVLHHFHAERPDVSPTLAIALLDECLSLLEYGLAPPDGPPRAVVQPLRNAIDAYLEKSKTRYRGSHEVPPLPSLEPLRAAGIPTVADEEFEAAMQQAAERRCLLLAMVRDDSWRWSDLYDAS